jgi:hypothetical protein
MLRSASFYQKGVLHKWGLIHVGLFAVRCSLCCREVIDLLIPCMKHGHNNYGNVRVVLVAVLCTVPYRSFAPLFYALSNEHILVLPILLSVNDSDRTLLY